MPTTTTPQRCPHLPEAHISGAIWCPYCGWVEHGLRQTNQQVITKHPEMCALVAANQTLVAANQTPAVPAKPRWFEEGSAFNLTASLLGATGRLIMWFFVLLIFLFFAAVVIGAYVHF
jgi:hypothetical protein